MNDMILILNFSDEFSLEVARRLRAEQIYGRQRKTKIGSEKLFEVTDQIIKKHIERGTIKE